VKVKINYLGLVKTYTNRIQDEKELPEETSLSELLDKLSSEFGNPSTQKSMTKTKKKSNPCL